MQEPWCQGAARRVQAESSGLLLCGLWRIWPPGDVPACAVVDRLLRGCTVCRVQAEQPALFIFVVCIDTCSVGSCCGVWTRVLWTYVLLVRMSSALLWRSILGLARIEGTQCALPPRGMMGHEKQDTEEGMPKRAVPGTPPHLYKTGRGTHPHSVSVSVPPTPLTVPSGFKG